MSIHSLPRHNGLVLLFVLSLLGCAPRPGEEVLAPVPPHPQAQEIVVHVVTNRAPASDRPSAPPSLAADRLAYFRYGVSIPPSHEPGRIEWPISRADPARTFAVVSSERLTETSFAQRLAMAPGSRDVIVFIHGYNTTLQEGLFRHAQIVADSGLEVSAVLFAWPSHGSFRGYVADREAATASRDRLVELLVLLAGTKGIGEISVIGHSMGGWLTMEALRQLRMTGQDDVIARLQVVLAAPDIDIDVFRSQITVVGPIDPPLTILVAHDDTALRASSRLGIGRPRLGALAIMDPRMAEIAASAEIALVDISDLRAPDVTRHSRFAVLAALYPELEARPGGMTQAPGTFSLNQVGTLIASPILRFAETLSPD